MGIGSYDVAIKFWQEKTIIGRKLESICHKEIVAKNIYSQRMGPKRTVSTCIIYLQLVRACFYYLRFLRC